MQRNFLKSMLASLALAVLGFAAPAQAQDGVYVVNLQQVWAETSVGQDLARQLTEMRTSVQSQVTGRSEELQSEMADLQRQRDEFIITDEVYEERATVLRQQAGGMQVGVQRAEQALAFANQRAQDAFFETIQPDLIAILEDRGGAVLLEMTSTIVWNDDINVTADAVTRVNNRVTELDLEPYLTAPEGAGEGE